MAIFCAKLGKTHEKAPDKTENRMPGVLVLNYLKSFALFLYFAVLETCSYHFPAQLVDMVDDGLLALGWRFLETIDVVT